MSSPEQDMLQAQYGEMLPVDPKGYVDLFHPFFRRLETERGLPTGLLSGMAEKESSGNTMIKNPKSSALGLFQITNDTAKDWGLSGNERTNPVLAATAAADVLAKRAQRYGIERAVGMHYGGPGAAWDKPTGPNALSPAGYAAKVFELAQRYAIQ